MHAPIFVRELSEQERAQLESALRAASAFTMRRAQTVLASAAGRRPREIARDLRCAVQTVRNAVRAFNATGVASLTAVYSRPRSAAWTGSRRYADISAAFCGQGSRAYPFSMRSTRSPIRSGVRFSS